LIKASPFSVVLVVLGSLGGCATNKEALLPHDNATMLNIWDQHTGGASSAAKANRELLDARLELRRPLIEPDEARSTPANSAYTRTARTEIHRLFPRLPNPDLVMYVFPHLAGSEQVPVPGYSTVFSFYRHVEYALPGERTDEY